MSRRTVVLLTIFVIGAVIAGILYVRSGTTDREYATATRGSLDVTIQTVGTIQATGATSVRAEVAGVIAQSGVALGETIDAGDVVATLDLAPFDTALADAAQRLQEAEYALQFAEQRSNESPDDASLKSAVLEAANRVTRARDLVDAATAARAQSVVVAPVSGVVIELQLHENDAVVVGQSIARISSVDDLQLIADIDELDLPNVSIGAEVRFRLDSFPATEIPGMVTSTAPAARQQGGATVFATTIDFDPPQDLDIRPGMNADVTVVTAQRTDVLLIPERALKTVGERVYVDIRSGDELEEREISLGYRGDGQVEVVDGLTDGDEVVLR